MCTKKGTEHDLQRKITEAESKENEVTHLTKESVRLQSKDKSLCGCEGWKVPAALVLAQNRPTKDQLNGDLD